MPPVPDLRLPESQRQPVLDRLCQCLRNHGYTEEGLSELYRHHACNRINSLFPSYFYRTDRDRRPLGLLARLFFQHQPQNREAVAELLSEEAVATLIEVGLMEEVEAGVRSLTDLYPVGDQFIFTDACFRGFPEKVYHVGSDSYALTHLAPFGQPRRALDLCTGSGVQAVANRHAQELHLVDINPRAVDFARFNLMLNGLSHKAQVHLGNLWEAAPGIKCDWISANPPFVPHPSESGLLMFQGGGGSGEEITQAILGGAEEHLVEGGILAITTNAPERPGESQIEKLRTWLGNRSRWGVVHLTSLRTPSDSYISHFLCRDDYYWYMGAEQGERQYHKEFLRWMRHYDRHRIAAMLAVVYVITRLPEGATEWSVDRAIADWRADNTLAMKAYQDSLSLSHGPQWHQHDGYRLQEGVLLAGPRHVVVNNPIWGLACEEGTELVVELGRFLQVRQSGQELIEWGQQRAVQAEEVQQGLCRLALWGALSN